MKIAKDDPQRKFIIIVAVILTIIGIVYWEYTMITSKITKLEEKHQEFDQLSLQANELELREKRFFEMKEPIYIVNNYLPTSDNIIQFIEQLESISTITNTSMSLQFESATISDGGIKFDDEKEKQDILKEIKNQTSPQVNSNSGGNVALQLLEASKQTKDEETNLNFLNINMIVTGKYKDIMDYIVTIKNTKYIIDIYDMQLVARTDGVQATIQARLYISNQ